ncbi:MAG TPA: AAA family ATPase [Candidatus Acidoferrum sp.]|nr:AAA family ATPase [Candidatus Acidoferrum sp.]
MSQPLAEVFGDVPEVAAPNQPSLKPLNLWRPSQFLAWTDPPGNHLLLPAYVTKSELTTCIGQGGVGKSRLFGLWLPICQITGRQWCGLKTGGEPQKWLVLGDENSVARIKSDLEHILPNLTAEERAKVDELLLVQAVLGFEDADLNLGDVTTQARVALTVEKTAPGAIVADPLVNFAPGDISKPGEMKEAIRLLAGTIRRAAPAAALVLLHHARTGRQNILQGVGWDAANFASGGKTLFAAARCQINLMPASEEDETKLLLSCAKANNCEKFPARGLIFDRQTYAYTLDPDFDLEEWKTEIEGRAHSGQSICTVSDVVSAVREGYDTTKALVEHLGEAYGTSKRSVHRLIAKTVRAAGIMQAARGQYTLGRKAEKLSPPILL